MRSRGTTTARGLGPLAAVGVMAVATLAGCTGDGPPPPPATGSHVATEPAPVPTPTPTPSPTPTDPAAILPERPEAMDTVDTAGAEAVATYYLQLVPYAEATGDTTALAAISHSECVFCASVLDEVSHLAEAGLHNSGGLTRFVEVSALEVDPARWWTVDLEVVQEAIEVHDATGVVVGGGQPEALTYHMDMAVIHGAGGWQVREVSYDVLAKADS